MKDQIDGSGSFSPDASVNSGQETQITPITLREFAMQIYKERVLAPEKPIDLDFFFAATTELEDGPSFPTVGLYFDPSWVDRNRTRLYLLKVNSIGSVRVGQHSLHNGLATGVHNFRVYDFPVSKLTDSGYVDDINEIDAADIKVAANIDDAKQVESWVADPRIRERINEWFAATNNIDSIDPREFSRKHNEIEKYVMLRQSPFNTRNVPGYGIYTYEGSVEEATKQTKKEGDAASAKMIDKPVTGHMFTLEDVKWLETYMKNKRIPITNKF